MANYTCRNGHTWKGPSSLSRKFEPADLICRECGLSADTKLKANGNRRNAVQAAEPPAIAEAHLRFTALVTEWPCFLADQVAGKPRRPDHRCWGRKDPHHLVPADTIRRVFGDLPDVELADILYAPILGVPLCRDGHEAVERGVSEHIYWQEVDDEAKEFCRRIDERYPGRESMYSRLQIECPVRGERKAA